MKCPGNDKMVKNNLHFVVVVDVGDLSELHLFFFKSLCVKEVRNEKKTKRNKFCFVIMYQHFFFLVIISSRLKSVLNWREDLTVITVLSYFNFRIFSAKKYM